MWYEPLCFAKGRQSFPKGFLGRPFAPALFVMKEDTKRLFGELWYYSSLSFSIALSIVIGLGIGYWLDHRVFKSTSPWFTLIFLGFGVAAGFRNIYLAMKKSQKM
jgi:ATP synthase protein I